MTEGGKVIFFLAILEKKSSSLTKERANLAEEVIDNCWGWLRSKENNGDVIYELLDAKENGITIAQEMSDNETDINTWNCVINAVAYTSRKAYEKNLLSYEHFIQ